jgi:hypothetical protein
VFRELITCRTSGLGRDSTEETPRTDAFLNKALCLLDFILLGRGSQVSVVLGKHAVKLKREELGRFMNESERMAALVKFMDGVTDAKLVREAEVYRPILVDHE